MKKTILTTILTMSFFLVMFSLPISNYAQGRNQNDVETTYVQGEYRWYESIEELTARATEIVKVRVIDNRTEWLNASLTSQTQNYEINTVFLLLVLEVFQGNIQAGDIIEVKQLGGHIGNEELVNLDKVSFEINDDLILFIRSWHHIDDRPSTLLTPWQSVYHVGEDGEPIALPDNDLLLTRIILEQIQKDNGIDPIILFPEEIEAARLAVQSETTNIRLVMGIAVGVAGLIVLFMFGWKRKKKKEKN